MCKRILRMAPLLIALCLLLAACKPGGPATPTTDKTLRVGMECAYAPFNWTQLDDDNGAVAIDGGDYAGGYDVEIAKLIAQGMGRELLIVKTEWDGLLPALTSGKIDLIIAGMSPTEERKQSIDFSDYYYTSAIVLVVKKDGPYAGATSLSDFVGARVTGQLDTVHYTLIDQMKDAVKQPAMEDFPSMIVALSSGKIEAYVSERPGAISAVASNPDLTYISFDEGNGFDVSADEISVSVGLQKNSPLLADVNAQLAKISDEERGELMEKAVLNQPSA